LSEPTDQLDLFPTSEPEIKGRLAACAVVLRGLIEALVASGSLTREQAKTLLHHSDLKSAFAIWDGLQGEMPDSELRRMEQQAKRFLDGLRRDIFSE
jgi:polyhydroxyalkanoate synthesis regulator phasin